jgi:hypothetical protein
VQYHGTIHNAFGSGEEGVLKVRDSPPTREKIKTGGDETMEQKGMFMFGDFDPATAMGETMKLMRLSFDAALDNAMKVQNFNLNLFKDMLEGSKGVQADAVQAMSDLLDGSIKWRDEYKKMIGDGLEKVGGMLAKKK